MHLFLLRIYFYFFQQTDPLKCCIKQPQSHLKNQKIEIKFTLKILFYRYVSYKSYISLKAVAWRCSIKILQNSLKNTCARALFKIMLWGVVSVPCQEYIKDKFLTHVPAFPSSNSFLFCFLLQCSDLPFENFVLYLHSGLDIKSVFRTLQNI